MSAAPKQPHELPAPEELTALLKKANAGDPKALAKLSQLLDANPHIWQGVGDLGQHAERTLIMQVAKDDALSKESIERHVRQMRQDLCGPKPTPMEKILVGRFVLAWLQSQYVNMMYPSTAGMSPAAGRFVLQQKEAAGRQLSSAQQALDNHRKLLPPKLKLREAIVPFTSGKPGNVKRPAKP